MQDYQRALGSYKADRAELIAMQSDFVLKYGKKKAKANDPHRKHMKKSLIAALETMCKQLEKATASAKTAGDLAGARVEELAVYNQFTATQDPKEKARLYKENRDTILAVEGVRKIDSIYSRR